MNKGEDFIEIQAVLDAFEIIGGKWKFPILYSLCKGKKRFKELEADLQGVSSRALSNALKDLEINGLVSRAAFPTVPVKVEYSLTEYGYELEPVIESIRTWGKQHRKRIFRQP
ncbi:winged helix-turn-helix transcriptional regulator [Roseivirga misakiensis]|uniref:HxlR family transcriptional regulator n=1 Tax=Roseivirga misakiensis TaxID=1563681 RepID=A0A1E5T546_9BACT|nr:helix-turn-helix domain-containing protein [Roseivirga misakiensis]OEK06495.1 HxlR family transcriptional regulator [Roseivirga misakiensis]